VIGGHACGILGGLVSYYLVVDPYSLLLLSEAVSTPGIFLGLGAVLSIAITTFLMLMFQVSHPPACATTLIISLGILPYWYDGLVILIAVVILYYVYWVYQKISSNLGLPE
jgi:CBS-domain-containing membrane protein